MPSVSRDIIIPMKTVGNEVLELLWVSLALSYRDLAVKLLILLDNVLIERHNYTQFRQWQRKYNSYYMSWMWKNRDLSCFP